jgi:hypothetical protein
VPARRAIQADRIPSRVTFECVFDRHGCEAA